MFYTQFASHSSKINKMLKSREELEKNVWKGRKKEKNYENFCRAQCHQLGENKWHSKFLCAILQLFHSRFDISFINQPKKEIIIVKNHAKEGEKNYFTASIIKMSQKKLDRKFQERAKINIFFYFSIYFCYTFHIFFYDAYNQQLRSLC